LEVGLVHTYQDYLDSIHATSQPLWARVALAMLLLIMFVGGVFLIRHDLSEVGWPWVIFTIGIGLSVYTIRRYVAQRRSKCMDGSEVVGNVEDTGTTTTSSKGKAELHWTAYSKYKETSELFVLFFESGNCAFIPKRVLSQDRIVELRQVLQGHIRKGEQHDSV
jgi:hypothetical protein